jgi:uncharacterized protein YhaN
MKVPVLHGRFQVDEVEFARQFRPDGPSTVSQVLARALATPDRAELEQAAAEKARDEALAERREATQMLNQLYGDPIGHVSRAQQAVAALRDEEADLTAKLEAVRGRLRQAAESLVDWGQQADEVLSASAQRSHTPDLLAEAKETLARFKVEQRLAGAGAAPKSGGRDWWKS